MPKINSCFFFFFFFFLNDAVRVFFFGQIFFFLFFLNDAVSVIFYGQILFYLCFTVENKKFWTLYIIVDGSNFFTENPLLN